MRLKKKIKIGALKIKISWKNSRLVKIWNDLTGANQGYTLSKIVSKSPEQLRDIKLYRLFKEKFCDFTKGKLYGENGTQPSSYVYYKGDPGLGVDRFLIGELLFGVDKYQFLKNKGIVYKEYLNEYIFTQNEVVLARLNKEWVEKQSVYQ